MTVTAGSDRFADAPRTKAGNLRHTCNGDDPRGLGFGRRSPDCARCAELTNGAPARPDPAAGRRDRNRETPESAEERARHRASCRACRTGGVCTAFDW